ncbi:MAG: nucleotidyltransferase domain-containing protein [bacterium]|nr:nucleotidyltransferase domain-containing protein [bacterium]
MEGFSFSNKEEELFKRLGISALVLFGSQAEGKGGPMSDFDFGIIVEDKSVLKSSSKRKEIYDELYDIFSSHIKRLVNIDIVFLDDAPYELRAHVMKCGKAIFEAKLDIFADFKATTMIMYSDFAPLRKIFHEGVLSKIN